LKISRVGFQGEHGAYSEAAIFKHYGPSIETVPSRTIREVFNLTEASGVDVGVVPIENSIEGSVYETYDMLLTSGVKVVGEIVLRVVHCLISLPSARLKDIKVIYSHPQALAQCRGFIASLQAEPIVTYDTAGSAKMIMDKRLNDCGAIASEKAAEIYGLKVLKNGIEDYGRNYTRFLVISRYQTSSNNARIRNSAESKTSILFSVTHKPGSLYKVLEVFAKENVNMTKIESRPTRQRPWEYYFFVDFEGHESDKKSSRVLREMVERTVFLKVLGSYPRSEEELS
jgi:prephenate dehydratase